MNRVTSRIVFIGTLCSALAGVDTIAQPPEVDTVVEAERVQRNIDPPSVVVKFADLNLARQAGVKALYSRLTVAVKIVCAPLEDRNFSRLIKWNECRKTAMSDAVASIDNMNLTNYFMRINGEVPVRLAAR
ncbi:MAG TPA: UrcA family protein [Steroidobacteraceae bacterium]|nr:UrcA family protein [Steroidobacteraceae bacterium]